MPLMPELKTESEIATMRWMGRNISLPIPKVLAFQSDCQNPTGFEWILMEKMSGVMLDEAWWKIDISAKENLARHLARYLARHLARLCSELFDVQMELIGSPFEIHDPDRPMTYLGLSVSVDFITRNAACIADRGPFASPTEWVRTMFDAAEDDCRYRLDLAKKAEAMKANARNNSGQGDIDTASDANDITGDDKYLDEDPEDLEIALSILTRLRSHITNFFPEDEITEPTMLVHHDPHRQNILVDESGQLTAILDWECVSTMPLSVACNFPKVPTTKPRMEDWRRGEPDEVADRHRQELQLWELAGLRKVFLAEMRKLQPAWVDIHQKGERQREFMNCLASYDDLWAPQEIRKWLKALESGAPDAPTL